jgi:hypothetical protein
VKEAKMVDREILNNISIIKMTVRKIYSHISRENLKMVVLIINSLILENGNGRLL